MLCFVTLKVQKLQSGWGGAPNPACWGRRVPPRHHFPPHLNLGSAPDLAKRKGTPFVSMYPLPNARGSSRIWPNLPPPPPPPPSPFGFGQTQGVNGVKPGGGGGGGGGGAISAFCPRAPNTLATPLQKWIELFGSDFHPFRRTNQIAEHP